MFIVLKKYATQGNSVVHYGFGPVEATVYQLYCQLHRVTGEALVYSTSLPGHNDLHRLRTIVPKCNNVLDNKILMLKSIPL